METWGAEWGFEFSVEKSQVMFFSKKKISENKKLNLYGKNLDRVNSFPFLGLIFDSRLTWREHVKGIVEKSKGVLNVMRRLAGLEWGADVGSFKHICGRTMCNITGNRTSGGQGGQEDSHM